MSRTSSRSGRFVERTLVLPGFIFRWVLLAFLLSTCTFCGQKDTLPACPEPEPCPEVNKEPLPAVAPKKTTPVTVVQEPGCPPQERKVDPVAGGTTLDHGFMPFPWKPLASHRLSHRITARPVRVSVDTWVFADHGGFIRALRLENKQGKWLFTQVWQVRTKDAVWSAPGLSLDGATLLAGSDDDSLYRIDAKSGKVMGTYTPFACTFKKSNEPAAARCDQDMTPVSLPDGGWLSGGAGVTRHDASGEILWQYPVTTHVRGNIVRDHAGNLYAVTLGGILFSLTENGSLRWQVAMKSVCDSTLLHAPDCTVVVGCDNRTLNAVSTLNGEFRWRVHAPDAFRGGGALSPDGRTLYWGNLDRHIYAIALDSGKVHWRYRTAGRHLGAPMVDRDGQVLVFPEEKRLTLLAPDGSLKGTLELPAIADTHPVHVDGEHLLLPLESGEILLLGN